MFAVIIIARIRRNEISCFHTLVGVSFYLALERAGEQLSWRVATSVSHSVSQPAGQLPGPGGAGGARLEMLARMADSQLAAPRLMKLTSGEIPHRSFRRLGSRAFALSGWPDIHVPTLRWDANLKRFLCETIRLVWFALRQRT